MKGALMVMVIIGVATLGIISVGVIWCCSKIGSDGNWYAEHKAESESSTYDENKN